MCYNVSCNHIHEDTHVSYANTKHDTLDTIGLTYTFLRGFYVQTKNTEVDIKIISSESVFKSHIFLIVQFLLRYNLRPLSQKYQNLRSL